MAIQKKSLIGNLATTQKAIIATNVASTPLQPVQAQPGLPSAKKGEGLFSKKGRGLTSKKAEGLFSKKR